jgi:thiamine-phosphate pyrophosphorylase
MITLPRLFVLTDRAQLPAGRTVIEQVERCLAGGATHVILREHDLPPLVRLELAEALTAIGATVIAAGEPITGTVGLHQPSAASGPVRGFVGRSCHTRAEVEQAARDRCTYATLGPFAATASKPGYGPPVPIDVFAGLPIPTFALGGIGVANATEVVAAGSYGVAVMGEVMRSRDPAAVVNDLVKAIR